MPDFLLAISTYEWDKKKKNDDTDFPKVIELDG